MMKYVLLHSVLLSPLGRL